MKLRIPRRIKVEDDSSDSENEPITSTSSGNFTNAQNNIENEIEKDKVLSVSWIFISMLALEGSIHLYWNKIL